MKINLTKKQYAALIKAVDAGDSIYGILGDMVSDNYKNQSNVITDLKSYLLGFAKDFEMEEITEIFHGKLIMSDNYSEKLERVMDDYNEETFWHELETRLGQRDFYRTITSEEEKEMQENDGWYPMRIHKLYEDYSKEFEKHGIERLEIKK